MYQVGDQVVYGVHGVCRVAAMEKQIVSRKTVTYLVLEPVGQEGSRYLVPMQSEAAMAKVRPILSPAELEALFHAPEVLADGWIAEENVRKNSYRELIASGDRLGLMRMVHTLYIHKKNQAAAGKKVHMADDNFLRDAEKLLAGEIAVVLGLQNEEARMYLRNQLKCE